jgi:CheY-like chemotaxis protein
MVPMSIKVLVFESDSAFAGELRSELGNLGCAVRVVDDGNVGLQQAQAERPDLILLSIELPRMNGFSVCNKLKKDAELKDVPLIIMSSESSEETFEQHKKLRTRAEAYVHKPIAFGELLAQIELFVALSANTPSGLSSTGDVGAEDDDSIVIDDDESDAPVDQERAPDSGRTAMFHVPTMPRPSHHVDPDVDAFADDAFGRLQSGGDPAPEVARPTQTRPPPPQRVPTGTRPPPPNGADAQAKAEELDRVKAELQAAAEARDLATSRARDLEKQLNAAQGEVVRVREEAVAEAERLTHDLEEARSRPPPVVAVKGASVAPKAVGGVSSREFLDLRETLSKKDKEILALKQQLTTKDREIFEVRDRSLAHEARASELDDRILAKDRELAEAGDKAEELGGQLDSTTKGFSDARTALDELEKVHEELRAKRDQENVTHEAATAASTADRQEAEKALRDEHAAAIAKAEAAHKSEIDAAMAAREEAATAHATAIDEATQAHAAATTELMASSSEAMAAAVAAHTAATEAATQAHSAAMAEATSMHAAAMAEATQAQTAAMENAVREHATAMADATTRHEEALSTQKTEADAAKAAAIAARESELKAETDAKLASLHRSQQDEVQRLRTEAEAKQSTLEGELAVAKSRGQDLEKQVTELTGVRATLEGQLGSAASKGLALDEELRTLRGELEVTRKDLARESSRATRAVAKWDADKMSLERAKDALAVALSQLDEAEARQLTD